MEIIPLDSRRSFLKRSGVYMAGALLLPQILKASAPNGIFDKKVKVSAHLWLYASAFPQPWDCFSVLEKPFSDLSYAGFDGVELMGINLTHNDSVERIGALIKKYNFPVTGSSYGADMWDVNKHGQILEEVDLVVSRLGKLGGKTFGISVGDAGHLKTEPELDAQAELLKKVLVVCEKYHIQPNLHNHTYEVEKGLHDLKGTLARIPDINLGPDLNWLIRAGVDPVMFINTYGKQIVYLHIRDQYADGSWTEYLGQGVTDFAAIDKALKTQNFQGRAAVELAFPKDYKPINSLKTDWKISREYVKNTFGW